MWEIRLQMSTKKKHSKCYFRKIQTILQSINSKNKTQATNKTQNIIQQLYNNIIQQISLEKQKILYKLKNFGLSENQLKLSQILQVSHQYQKITGSLINQIASNQEKQSQNNYHIDQSEFVLNIIKEKKLYIKDIEDLLIKIQKQIFNHFRCTYLPSNILTTKKENFQLFNLFGGNFSKGHLRYRASQQQFSIQPFRYLIQGSKGFNSNFIQKNTLLLIQTVTGNKIAAFFSPKWPTKQGIQCSNLNKNDNFIWSKSNNKVYRSVDLKKSVIYKNSCGPCFGESDIIIRQKANENPCCFKFKTYSNTNQPLLDNQNFWTQLSGATDGYEIKLK